MAAANVFVAFGGALNEAPRLTTMLRAFATERGAAFDVDEEFLKRRRALDARRKRVGGEGRGLGKTGLALRLFGSWEKTPRAAKESYNVFLKAVADLLSGQSSSEELQEYAWAAWRACKKAPDKEQLTGRGSRAALKPVREAMVATFGMIEDTKLQSAVLAYHALKEYHDKLGQDEEAKWRSQSRHKGEGLPGALMEQEFGANIHLRAPVERTRDAAVLAMCGIQPNEVGPGINRQPSASPLSAKDMAASYAVAPPPEPAPSVTQWEPDYDSDEGKGTKQRVSLKWLRQWVEKMSTSADTDIEELGLSVCQTILTAQSGDQMADDLCGLLGWEALELVQELVEHRIALHGLIISGIDKAKKAEAADRNSGLSSAFTITTEYEKKQLKLERKGRKKKGGTTGTHLEWLSAAGFSYLLEMAGESKVWMFDGQFDLSGGTGGEQKSALPAGSKRRC